MATNSSSSSYALLLLPSAPSSFDSLKAAYLPALTTVLLELSKSVRGTDHIGTLDISVTTPGLLSPESQPRARHFATLQRFLTNIYKLIGVVAAKESIELDIPGGVDARVFFLDYDNSQPLPPQDLINGDAPLQGPIIDLRSLVSCSRKWSTVYSLQTDDGEALLTGFTNLLKSRNGYVNVPAIRRLVGGTTSIESNIPLNKPTDQLSPHYFVAVGGTFDHLHAGHKLLLTATALAIDPCQHQLRSEHGTLTVGITGDELLVNKKYAEYLESWELRWQRVSDFLESIINFSPPGKATADIEHVSQPGANGQYVRVRVTQNLDLKFVQISDPFGPTITDESISALVVSKETRSGGKAVNDEREKKGWRKLDVFEVDVLDFEDVEEATNASTEAFASKISSTVIRRRRMNMTKGNL